MNTEKITTPLTSAHGALFVPLKRHFFESFRDGSKSVEYRAYGPRWNERTCRIGRRVTLSLGYGKTHRLSGVIVDFRKDNHPGTIPGWSECYGPGARPAACISIRLDAPHDPR